MNRLHACGAGLGFVLLSASISCGGSEPAPSPPTPPPVDAAPPIVTLPPDGPVPAQRTGDLPPIEATIPTLHVSKRFVHGDTETLRVSLDPSFAERTSDSVSTFVHVNDRAPSFAFSAPASKDEGACLWIRRALTETGKPIDGTIAISSEQEYRQKPGERVSFHVDADVTAGVTDPTVEQEWFQALYGYFQQRAVFGDSFSTFVADRAARFAKVGKKTKSTNGNRGPVAPRARAIDSSDEMELDLDILSGSSALRSALALEKAAPGDANAPGKSVPASSVKAFAMPSHPWAQMGRARATASSPAKPEPLAALTPAEFYYLRAEDVPTLEQALDQMDTLGSAATHLAPIRRYDDDELAASYQTQLGLVRSPQSKMIGAAAIGRVAIVGSDVYLSEGTDVSLIFEVKAEPLFDAAMAESLARQAKPHGAVNETTRTHASVTVTVSTTADGAVHRERADLGGGFVVFSNSPTALDLIVDTAQGNHPKLASEPDFSYVLARDAGTPDGVFSFLGDRFFVAMASPRTRILEGRRRIAAAELTIPAYAALLYGWFEGRSPKRTDDVVAAGLLTRKELSHSSALGGGAIAFQPETAPSSKWGRPGTMVPLIDLPTPSTYTKSEASSYGQFSTYYQSMWSEYVDPAAIRVSFTAGKMSIDFRQLPVPTLSKYRDLGLLAGDTRVAIPSGGDGLRFTISVGRDSELRREASSFLGSFAESKDDLLGWLGDSITVGILDRSVDARSMTILADLPEPPDSADAGAPPSHGNQADEAALAALPMYASIDVQNPVTAGLLLAIGRKQIERDLSDSVHWEDGGNEGTASITRIRVDSTNGYPGFTIFYAFADGAFDVALDDAVLRTVIRARKAGDRATTSRSRDTGAQHVLEIATEPHDGLATGLVALLSPGYRGIAAYGERFAAEAYFRGIPEHAKDPEVLGSIGQLYTGSQPRTPDDAQYHWSDEGVVDPVRGTFAHPRWPTLPVAGSPLAKLFDSIARFRAEIAFDDESDDASANPGAATAANAATHLRSLHARATFILR